MTFKELSEEAEQMGLEIEEVEFDEELVFDPEPATPVQERDWDPDLEDKLEAERAALEVGAFQPILPDHRGMTYRELGETTPTCFLTGAAGTGKSYAIRQHIAHDPEFALLTATTGIAAVNLGAGVRTIHSTLKCGTTRDFEDAFVDGKLMRSLREVKKEGYRWLVIDEISMCSHRLLGVVLDALDHVNSEDPDSTPLGLMLTGDLAQLPPIPDKILGPNGFPKKVMKRGKLVEESEPTPWVFLSNHWERFHSNTIRLEKVWRQDNPEFLAGLNHIRKGVGTIGAGMLKASGVTFTGSLLRDFDGTTILSKNDDVDRFNQMSLNQLPGAAYRVTSTKWSAKRDDNGREILPGDWKNIPEKFDVKDNALVMILNNETETFSYVNGDMGHIREILLNPEGEVSGVKVELIRTGQVVLIEKISRFIEQKGKPEEEEIRRDKRVRRDKVYGKSVWILGECNYLPIRIAYASTCHKCQGLTLDRVQIDPSGWFWSTPGMIYVALSRARTPEGLVIVGSTQRLAEKVKIDGELKRRGFL